MSFLTESDNSRGVYTLTGGPQGLVEIVDNATVKSHGRLTDPIAKKNNGQDKDSFLKEVQEQAKRWPKKGTCCS